MITHKITLDVARDGVQANVILIKGESKSRDIAITLRNGKAPIELTAGMVAALSGRKPGGGEIFNSCVVYSSMGIYPNTIIYHVTDGTVDTAGTFSVRLVIWDDEGARLWTPEFSITVKGNGQLDMSEATKSQNEYTALIDAAVAAQRAAKEAEANAERITTAADELKKNVEEQIGEAQNTFNAGYGELEERIETHMAHSNPHNVTAETVGLERVDNTSDEEKPLSAAAREELKALGQLVADTKGEILGSVVKRSSIVNSVKRAYVIQNGTDGTVEVRSDSKADSLAQRYTDGRLKVGEPVAAEDAATKKYVDDTKVGKTGDQAIDGTLSVKKLVVEMDSTIADTEHLLVKDAVIVANAEGVELAGVHGYIIRVNAQDAYGIVYEPISDTLKIGKGEYLLESYPDVNGGTKVRVVFTFGEDQGQAIATRGNIADGNLALWDDEAKTFRDAGINAQDFIDSTEAVNTALAEIIELQEEYLIPDGDEVSY